MFQPHYRLVWVSQLKLFAARVAVKIFTAVKRQEQEQNILLSCIFVIEHIVFFGGTNSSARLLIVRPRLTLFSLNRKSSCSSHSRQDCAPNSAKCLMWCVFFFSFFVAFITPSTVKQLFLLRCVISVGRAFAPLPSEKSIAGGIIWKRGERINMCSDFLPASQFHRGFKGFTLSV